MATKFCQKSLYCDSTLDPSFELFEILNIETDSVKTYTISNYAVNLMKLWQKMLHLHCGELHKNAL